MGAKRKNRTKKRAPHDFTARPLPRAGGRGRPRTAAALPFSTTLLAGDRLLSARTELKEWTQAELAQRSGVSQRDVSLYETNMRAALFPTVVKIANALGVSLDYLACRSNDPQLR